jgi:uncharacterized cofD-like protein
MNATATVDGRTPSSPRRLLRVAALGGGTGLPAVLRGMRDRLSLTDRSALTAVVTMTDDGGSSGRLRRTLGALPPGDVRRCLVALSEEENLMAGLFEHRYNGNEGIGGHTVGNLILTALAEQTGSFLRAVEASADVLRIRGRILPSTQDNVQLEAILDNGRRLLGETSVAETECRIRRIQLRPRSAKPSPGVLEAIRSADLVVLGPGSLFTSVLPNIVVDGVAQALRETRAVVVLAANLVSERGEAAGLELRDHLAIIDEHVGAAVVDAVLAHEGAIATDVLERYRAEGSVPLSWTWPEPRRPCVIRRNLLASGPKLRHDPLATAEGLVEAWKAICNEVTRS